jgi:Protein of unknown function (DUF4199)
MKTYLTYGFLLTLAAFLLRLVVFICGLQSDPANLALGSWIIGLGGLAIGITFLVLGIKARRAAAPAGSGFSYGQAFGAGCGVQAFASIFAVPTTYLYAAVINPHLTEAILEGKFAKLQERGIDGDQLEKVERFSRMFASPTAQSIEAFIGTFLGGIIIVLIAAAFLQRREPPVTA